MRARDAQRQAVYDWERSLRPWLRPDSEALRPLSLDECRELIQHVWRSYFGRAAVPQVKDGRGCSWARGSHKAIVLPRWARHRLIVLHEVAHAILWQDPDTRRTAAHGPLFVRLVIELWHTHYVMHRDATEKLAREFPKRILIADVRNIPQPRRKRSAEKCVDGK